MLLLQDQAPALHPSHPREQTWTVAQKMPGNGCSVHTGRVREGKQRGLPREMVLLHTQSVFFGCLFPSPCPGCRAAFGRLSPQGLSRGVALLQALIRCVLVSKTIQTKAFHLHLCTVPELGRGLVSAPGWDWSTINVSARKLMGFWLLFFFFLEMEILGWIGTDE